MKLLRKTWDPKTEKFRQSISIDDVRGIKQFFNLSSTDDGQRVVIIDSADDLQNASANALLKILEEPPENTTLILVSDKRSALLPTIISRCQPMNFPALNLDQTRQILEQGGVGNEAATQLAMVAKGDVHLAKELSERSTGDILAEAEALTKLMTKVDGKGWRDFINNNAMLAARKPDEFKFRLYLLQLWFHHAYEMRSGTLSNGFVNGMAPSLEKFNAP